MVVLSFCKADGQNFASVIDINEINNLLGSSCFAKLKTGEEINGKFAGVTTTTGYISKVIIKPDKGEKVKLKSAEIVSWSVKSSGFTEMAAVPDSKVTTKNMSLSSSGNASKDDYIVFETVNTGKASGVCLLQLLNPGIANKIKVYAYEVDSGNSISLTDSKGGNMTYTGRSAITYLFVKEGDDPAKVKKSNFRKKIEEIFSDCPKMMSEFHGEKIRWDDIARHVFAYNQKCK